MNMILGNALLTSFFFNRGVHIKLKVGIYGPGFFASHGNRILRKAFARLSAEYLQQLKNGPLLAAIIASQQIRR